MASEAQVKNSSISTDLRQQLAVHGWVHIRAAAPEDVADLCDTLGEVLMTTDVKIDETAKGMVTSDRALGLHTDHGGVDYILWHCKAQTDQGGISRLLDTRPVLAGLSHRERQALREVYLTEHRVFTDDPQRRPLLRQTQGGERVYYSFWLLHDELDERQKQAVEAFIQGVKAASEVRIQLEAGDILIVDNRRVLHGRTAIEGTQERHLKRYWIRENTTPTAADSVKNQFTLPDPITEEDVRRLIEDGVDPKVAQIDLSMVKMKLQNSDEGAGWTPAQCEEAELEYKRYLTLNMRYEDRAIVPTKQIDTMWHFHILDTRAYHDDCVQVFGEYFHHYPYFGMRGEADEQQLKASFFETVELYQQEFGEDMLRDHEVATDCWHDCQGRCWHACKSK